ncbi:MAG: hypothetical protein ACXWC4_18195 [Telluria sp.]
MKAASFYLAPTAALRHLAIFLKESGSTLTVEQAATIAINQWIAAARGAPANISLPPMRGYQWKSLFLPEGTALRMFIDRKFHYARVEGEVILHEGRAVTPQGFTTACGGRCRNAWRDVWLLLPGERQWYPASTLRRQCEQELAGRVVAPTEAASPVEAVRAAAECMSEALRSALALVENASEQAVSRVERRGRRARRGEDTLADHCRLD